MGGVLARYLWFIFGIYAVVLTIGCGKIDTAEKLAAALKRKGVDYQTIEPLEAPKGRFAKVDEAVALKGENLWVEIFRIEDQRTYKLFVGAGAFLFTVEKKIEKDIPDLPVTMLARKPFVIVVREEPVKDHVKQALNRIFPQKED
jgi:hypothetical protein